MKDRTHLLFDWGDTLMADDPSQRTPMVTWDQVSAMPGVLETMPLLAEQYTCVVVSNAGDSNAETMEQAFARIGLDRYFTFFYTSKELGAVKPHKDFFTAALGKLGISSQQACMIGNDYEKDILGAKNAGIASVLLSASGDDTPEADHVVPVFSDLIPLFL